MKRCPRCKEQKPRDEFSSSGYCHPCNRARAREWALKNPEHARRTAKQYREANKDKIRKKKLAEYHALMAKDPEKVRARRRAWAKTDKGVISYRFARHKRRGAKPDALAREYAAILLRDPCSYCADPATEIDHIDPLADEGDGDWTNLTAACRTCNARKNDTALLMFTAA